MSKLKRAATVLGATAATVVLTFTFSTPAFAGTYNAAINRSADGYVSGACLLTFQDSGDHFFLDDMAKDGAGCWGTWAADGRSGQIWNTGGYTAKVDDNENLIENTKVTFEVCIETNHNVIWDTCGFADAVA